MLLYLLRRFAGTLPTLLVVATLTFFLLRIIPGGPFDSDQAWPPEIQANIERKFHLNHPVSTQYWFWLQDLLKGDLGESFQYSGKPVLQLIQETLPVSAMLGFCSLGFAFVMGIFLGSLAASKRGKWLEQLILGLSVTGVTLPSYLIASLLILLFSLYLGWLPPALWEEPSSIILPMLTLSLRPMAIVTQLSRTALLETLSADYIRTAHGKGLSQTQVLYKHALRNSLIPVVSNLGPLAANLLTGSFLVEVIFQIPGLGKYFVQGVLNRDYPLVMGITVVYGAILILVNTLTDLTCAAIDPRIRLEKV